MKIGSIILIVFEIAVPVVLFMFLFLYYIKDRDSKYYKKIDFGTKNEYLPCYYLCGDCHLSANIAVISKSLDGYLIETEDRNGKVDNFFLKFSDVDKIIVNPVDSNIKKKNKVRKGYEISIITKHDLKFNILSKKNPKPFFNI